MKSVFVFFAFIALNVLATDQVALTEMWREGDIYHPMSVHPGTKALLSKKCAESSNNCQALAAVKKNLNLTFTETQLSGGKNPSSLLCSIGHKSEVIILKNANGNENSFCRFPDLSIVSANDLR